VKGLVKRVSIVVLVIAAFLIAAYTMQLFLLVFAGILLAIVFRSAGNWLARQSRLSVNWAMGIVLAVFAALLLGMLWEFGSSFANEANEIMLKASQSLSAIQKQASQYRGLHQLLSSSGGGVNLQQSATSAVSGITEAAAAIVLVLFVGIYVSVDPRLYTNLVLKVFPQRQRRKVDDLLDEAESALKWWLLGQLIAMAVVGIIAGIGLLIVKVPMALPLAVLAALLTFVPYLGAIVSAVPAILIGFTVSSQTAMYVVLVFLVAHIAEGYVVVPMIQHRFVYLPPALILTTQFFMELLLGIVGITMATPLLVIGMVLINRLYFHQNWEEAEAA
jgi:predicted PurR-regulated permease PerM